MRTSAILVLMLVMLGNLGAWAVANRPEDGRPWAGLINGVALSPYQVDQNPIEGRHPGPADIERDISALSGHVKSVRSYSSLNGADLIPQAARRHGLTVTQGAWIQGIPEVDEAEIANLVRLTRHHDNVRRVLVGNEAILRTDVTVPEQIANIERVKRQVNVPVSTAEPWHVWLDHPELVAAVDYITVHILPYWEGVPAEGAVEYALFRYDELKAKYPGKHILIGEIGWPSDGPWRRGAEASLVNQAKFLRTFFNVAARERLDYYVMEAFDQPWKRTLEGTAGANWGMWDAMRQPKFPLSGGILEVPDWPVLCAVALAMAFLPTLWFVFRRSDLKPSGQFFYAALIQASASILVWTGASALSYGMAVTTEIAWAVLLACQVVLLAVMLFDGLELTEVVWTDRWRRRFEPARGTPGPDAPKVSIHVPCYNEPPHMVMQTLNALAKLDYPNFEVLIIDNNTRDEAVWRPVEAFCHQLGDRFRFFHLPKWPGYKAGALNFGLDHTAPDAEIVAVIDSDYQVAPDWLSATVPYFQRAEVGFVQSPQDYRDWGHDTFQAMCNWEYQGFFKIGMIQRNERNAIIQHGTMTLIRKSALVEVGRWGEWCITEDAELGLRLFEAGYEAVYMPDSFGRGLVPDSFAAYKTQRFRWAYGAVQILKRHWREMMPGSRTLTPAQRYHFLTGWLPWFADAAHMAFAAAAVFWSLGLLAFPKYFEFPPTVFMVPTLSVFGFKIVCSLWLYEERVRCTWPQKIGAAVAGMALTHTVGRAIWQGMFTSGRPFVRTPKCENQPAIVQGLLHAREEIGLMLGLWLAAAAIVAAFGHENRDAFLWAGLLAVQSLPYLAALATSMINVLPALRLRRRNAPPQVAEAEAGD
ncbi:glycosyltransferase [Skermanella sp. TT6]|uniref:Glycosyltransferase n=1 Tax=Skermanella cutis TaxID=2775420 RepID=A0ABX7BCW5_9PROT|nr:glycosyltransferase [Skermanella sp. TT6]QQP90272.1 glycosyltransferase [Skermanella sp. TT6]